MTALMASFATLTLVLALEKAEPSILHSTVFDWNSVEVKPTKVGARRSFFQTPTATLKELEMHVTTLNPGQEPHPPHKHPEEEMIIVKEGMIESTLNGVSRPAGPGSVVFQASNEMHGIRNTGSGQATYYVIKFVPK
jgi:quercetin dioxygenase-like cupin family protein